MTLIAHPSGGLIANPGGALAAGTDCCCDEPVCECDGCAPGTAPPLLSVAFQGGYVNPAYTVEDCTLIAGACEIDVTVILPIRCDDSYRPIALYDGCDNVEDDCTNDPGTGHPDTCSWPDCAGDTSSFSIGPLPGFGTTCQYNQYAYLHVSIWECDGEWWVTVLLRFSSFGSVTGTGECPGEHTPAGSDYEFVWQKSLGLSQPDCSAIFPITLGPDDHYGNFSPDCLDPLVSQIQAPCLYDDATLVLDLP